MPHWYDVLLLTAFSWNGLLLGFASLQVVHGVVQRRRNVGRGWGVAVAALFLAGFGIYLGRFERWNSWDVVTNPLALVGPGRRRGAAAVATPADVGRDGDPGRLFDAGLRRPAEPGPRDRITALSRYSRGMIRPRVALLAILLCCLIPTVAAADDVPSAVGISSRDDLQSYLVRAHDFIESHQRDPRSATLALEMLAVADWAHQGSAADFARAYLLFFQPQSPQALLAAKSLGDADAYAEFVLARLQSFQQAGPAETVAGRFLDSLVPGNAAFGSGLFQNRRLGVTSVVLGRWLLATHRDELGADRITRLEELRDQLAPAVERALRADDAGNWAAAGTILLDESLDPAERVERLASTAASDPEQPTAALDLALLMLPADVAMTPQITRVRAGQSVDAGRWQEAATLAQTLLDRPDEAGDLAPVRRWQALALAAGGKGFAAPQEALKALEGDPASAELLAALRRPGLRRPRRPLPTQPCGAGRRDVG